LTVDTTDQIARRIPLLVLALGILLGTAAPAGAQQATPSVSAASGDFAGRVDIGGRSLYLECQGSGSPTVVLEAGAANDADTWDTQGLDPGVDGPAVLPAVATFTRVCAYDRPGTMLDLDHRSRSDPVPMPRSAQDVAGDLHALLQAADLSGPYVLVGHSFGGMVTRLYASEYPADVVGLVSVDGAEEGFYEFLTGPATPAQRAAFSGMSSPAPELQAAYPDFERLDIIASAAQTRQETAASPLRPMPLVVLSHGQGPLDFGDLIAPRSSAELEQPWQDAQHRLAGLVPGGRFMLATQSGHLIQSEQPELVIDAIRNVVTAVHAGDHAPSQLPG
jgi:pimeloyl-ACP methyl ester carboxylesterase